MLSVADPRFPRGVAKGDTNLLFDKFSRKLHENGDILTGGGTGGEECISCAT